MPTSYSAACLPIPAALRSFRNFLFLRFLFCFLFGFVFIFGTMVFACRESFLSFKSFPCRPLTSILCHIPCPCRSLRRRHLFFFGSRTRFMQLHLFCRIFLQIPRCIIPANADNIADIQLLEILIVLLADAVSGYVGLDVPF